MIHQEAPMAGKQSATATRPVSDATEDNLRRISRSDQSLIESMTGTRDALKGIARLDAKSFALVKIAALIAVDAPPASFVWQIGNAISEGVTPEDIVGTLWAVGPQVGAPRIVAAAPEIMIALGLALDTDGES
jgi:4-carboxymuconolactone decarboxylase